MRRYIPVCCFFLCCCTAALAQGTLDAEVARLVDGLTTSSGEVKGTRVAVFPFTKEDTDKVTKFGGYLQETVSTQLVRNRKLKPVNRHKLKKLIEELDFQSSDFVDEKTRRKLGKFAGADLLLLGTYWDLGEAVKISISIHELETADTVAAGSCLVSRLSVPTVLLGGALGLSSSRNVKKAIKAPARKVTKPAKTLVVTKKTNKVKVELTSRPPGAKVYWKGRFLGKTWRPLVHYCEEGEQAYTFVLAGHLKKDLALKVSKPGPVVRDVVLEKPAGSLMLQIQPKGAKVSINGKELVADEKTSHPLAPGMYTVKISAEGCEELKRVVVIKSHEKTTLKCVLKRKQMKDSIGIEFVWIPPGTFMMGALKSDKEARDNEFPRHRVTLTKGFWLGKYEVTQEQWLKVMGRRRSHFKGRRRPVEKVSWDQAHDFCRRLSLIERTTYRLPSEAEWEYACRAGNAESRYLPVRSCAWTRENTKSRTMEVGKLKPNAFGLYDMLGNVYEWTKDKYGPYQARAQIDPVPFDVHHHCVARGGCWAWDETWARASARYRRGPKHTKSIIGIRVVREP